MRLKQRFASNVEKALFENSGARFTQSLNEDGSRFDRYGGAKRMQTARPTLPKEHTHLAAESATMMPLPSDANPWDRLHVWLCDGEALPRRPRAWPFEPVVVVTAVGDDTGSNIAAPIGTYEFQARGKHMNETHPVWDEQGMVCFKRSGTSGFRVEILGSGKLWSGLYHAHVLRPAALLRSFTSWLAIDMLVFLPLRLIHRVLVAYADRTSFRSATPAGTLSTASGQLHLATRRSVLRAVETMDRALAWQQQQRRSRQLQEQAEHRTFELPAAGASWQDYRVDLPSTCGGSILLRVRVSAWEDRPLKAAEARRVEEEATAAAVGEGEAAAAATPDAGGSARASAAAQPCLAVGMEHAILDGADGNGIAQGEERAVISFYPRDGRLPIGKSALLWMPGRNDAFFHPHVAELLARHSIDLYVLCYRRMGVCRRLGIFTDPMHNSHTATGSLAEYREDVERALAFIRRRGRGSTSGSATAECEGGGEAEGSGVESYESLLGYGHSTGACVLLDYIMARGDEPFAGLIFNSPFLDWRLPSFTKAFIRMAPAILVKLGVWANDTELLGGGGPSSWAYQLYSQYPFHPDERPLYTVPVTIGFVRAMNSHHAELRRRSRAGTAVTRKPFLVLTSMHDDVLEGDEMAQAAHAIGPNRTLIQLCHARHDVFVSAEASVIGLALDNLRAWLIAQGFPEQHGGGGRGRQLVGALAQDASSISDSPDTYSRVNTTRRAPSQGSLSRE